MPNIAAALREEITRLARKEIRSQTESLTEGVGGVSQAHSRPEAARAGPRAQACPVPATDTQGRTVAGS